MSKVFSIIGLIAAVVSLSACQPAPEAKKELQELQEKCKKDATNPECTENKGGPN